MPYAVDVSATSTAPPEVVFEHLAVIESWPKWAHLPVKGKTERPGDEVRYGVGAIRNIFPAREQVVAFEPPKLYAYVALSGLPVKDYRADVTLEPSGGGTAIRWQSRFEPKVPGTGMLVQGFMHLMLASFIRSLARHTPKCRPGCPAHQGR